MLAGLILFFTFNLIAMEQESREISKSVFEQKEGNIIIHLPDSPFISSKTIFTKNEYAKKDQLAEHGLVLEKLVKNDKIFGFLKHQMLSRARSSTFKRYEDIERLFSVSIKNDDQERMKHFYMGFGHQIYSHTFSTDGNPIKTQKIAEHLPRIDTMFWLTNSWLMVGSESSMTLLKINQKKSSDSIFNKIINSGNQAVLEKIKIPVLETMSKSIGEENDACSWFIYKIRVLEHPCSYKKCLLALMLIPIIRTETKKNLDQPGQPNDVQQLYELNFVKKTYKKLGDYASTDIVHFKDGEDSYAITYNPKKDVFNPFSISKSQKLTLKPCVESMITKLASLYPSTFSTTSAADGVKKPQVKKFEEFDGVLEKNDTTLDI